MKPKTKIRTEKAAFAAGCFWGIQAAFKQVSGVVRTAVGYTGGTTDKPTYEDVCSDTSGHAEAVLVEFNPKKISYGELLEIFWKIHDPTQMNRQGPDVGTQYRSAIFYHNEKQKIMAEKSMKEHQDKIKKKIVTQIVPVSGFYPAEDYHQNYYDKHGMVCKV